MISQQQHIFCIMLISYVRCAVQHIHTHQHKSRWWGRLWWCGVSSWLQSLYAVFPTPAVLPHCTHKTHIVQYIATSSSTCQASTPMPPHHHHHPHFTPTLNIRDIYNAMHVFLPTSWSWTWVLSLHIFWASQASFFTVLYSFKAIELLNGKTQKP